MSCPTCDHTMHVLGVIDGRRHLHCSRCGTHRIECGNDPDGATVTHDTVPMLVNRCRTVVRLMRGEANVSPHAKFLLGQAHGLGLIDSINRQGERT